jgi:hypothetical protein
MSKKAALIMRATEMREIISLLTHLAAVYAVLGFPEDAAGVNTLITTLKNKIGEL